MVCWERLRQCEQEISTYGVLVAGANGARVKNPAIQVARQYRDALFAWSKEIGLTFASRSRLSMPGSDAGKPPNTFEELARGSR